MIKLTLAVYRSYRGDKVNHRLRIVLFLLTSAVIAVYGVRVGEDCFPVMTLTLSVLTGFCFTALFSEPSVRATDLPKPLNETDRDSLGRLKTLSDHFQTRVRLFLVLAIVQLTVMLALTIKLSFAAQLVSFTSHSGPEMKNYLNRFFEYLSLALFTLQQTAIGFVMFAFAEWLYTFYRLSETILAILAIRAKYLESRK